MNAPVEYVEMFRLSCEHCPSPLRRLHATRDAAERESEEHQREWHPELMDPPGRCVKTLGSRPSWMSPDQYDPCQCERTAGHEGWHWCRHIDQPQPDDVWAADLPVQGEPGA